MTPPVPPRTPGLGSQPRFLEALLATERELSALNNLVAVRERDISARLVPTIERRRAELLALRRKLLEARPPPSGEQSSAAIRGLEARLQEQGSELAALRSEHRLACLEVAALRSSGSWRLMAPARRLYALLVWFRAGKRP